MAITVSKAQPKNDAVPSLAPLKHEGEPFHPHDREKARAAERDARHAKYCEE